MKAIANEKIRRTVRQHYAEAATKRTSCCESPDGSSSCCGSARKDSSRFAYSENEIRDIPEGSNLGLGCGNPLAIEQVQPGETILDLGSGGGIDCFLAAIRVGDAGRVIGIDMTPDMVSTARENAEKKRYKNVEFRLGEIENLPVADESVDAVISNCVINLSPDKPRVFSEVFRVLKPGGRVAIADMVATEQLTDDIKANPDLYVGCIAGAAFIDDLENILRGQGFREIRIELKDGGRDRSQANPERTDLKDVVFPATIEARKPDRPCHSQSRML
jgi:arsenite methyltransferase